MAGNGVVTFPECRAGARPMREEILQLDIHNTLFYVNLLRETPYSALQSGIYLSNLNYVFRNIQKYTCSES